jgi:hypothetical protein
MKPEEFWCEVCRGNDDEIYILCEALIDGVWYNGTLIPTEVDNE